MQDTIFHKILRNSATEEEKEEFYKQLENDPKRKDEYLRYKNLYVLSTLDSFTQQHNPNKLFRNFWEKTQTGTRRIGVYQLFKYAAVFILALALGGVASYFFQSANPHLETQVVHYSSTQRSISVVKLDDGSSIWLSSGTDLEIERNQKDELTAKLDGEAFFDLIPNSDRKFQVDLGKFQVKDIGTKFNIRAYSNESSITTSLVEGKIELVNNSEKLLESEVPGESISYDRQSNEITVVTQDPSLASSWKDGKFVFINKSLREMCEELENWYNIRIDIEDQDLANTHYTSVVKRSTTVKMVLEFLAITDGIKYEITDLKEGKDIIKISR